MSLNQQLAARLLTMTAAFEGGLAAVAGNHDGMILSLGPLQWNIGQGTLQPILRVLAQSARQVVTAYCGRQFSALCLQGGPALTQYIKDNIIDRNGNVYPSWRTNLTRLCLTPEAQTAFLAAAAPYLNKAVGIAEQLGFTTERGLALCFDIAVQNGAKVGNKLRDDHMTEYRRILRELEGGANLAEYERLKALAQAVANCSRPQYRLDVLSRKLTIALGSSVQSQMAVHGKAYNIERDFNISYSRPWKG